MVGIVDLGLLFKSPKKDARIIGWMGEEASSRGAAMEVNFMLKNHSKPLGKKPLL